MCNLASFSVSLLVGLVLTFICIHTHLCAWQTEPSSYAAIAADMSLMPEDILFVSDSIHGVCTEKEHGAVLRPSIDLKLTPRVFTHYFLSELKLVSGKVGRSNGIYGTMEMVLSWRSLFMIDTIASYTSCDISQSKPPFADCFYWATSCRSDNTSPTLMLQRCELLSALVCMRDSRTGPEMHLSTRHNCAT